MKKLLISSMVFTVMLTPAAIAATSDTGTTYTEKFIQKHTQKLVDTEKKLQEQQKANQEAAEAKRQANQEAWEKKKQEWKNQQEQKQAEKEKNKQELQKKIEKKKQAWQELISD